MNYKKLPENQPTTITDVSLVDSISIHFHEDSSHYGIMIQAIEKLARVGFSSEKEIKEEWLSLLQKDTNDN